MTEKITAPLAESVRIVLAGIRNAGKSSLMNNLLRQSASIVAPRPGTTTDPVTRRIELGDLGPAALTDTAGLDDPDSLGSLRVGKSRAALAEADIVILVTPSHLPLAEEERRLLEQEKRETRPLIVVFTHGDRPPHSEKEALAGRRRVFRVDNLSGEGVEEVLRHLGGLRDGTDREITPVEGIVRDGDTVVLVTPIDSAAPRGRLILPQVETIRDLLDRNCVCVTVKETGLGKALAGLSRPPDLVITDSQVFHAVAAELPTDQPLTSFSILFGRKKGDLGLFLEGVRALDRMPRAAHVLVLEACSHHRKEDDIGTVKIPRIVRGKIAPEAEFTFSRDFPDAVELKKFDLVIHCAACMLKRRVVVSRMEKLRAAGVPVVNYGLFLAWANGLFPRVLRPIPEAGPLL